MYFLMSCVGMIIQLGELCRNDHTKPNLMRAALILLRLSGEIGRGDGVFPNGDALCNSFVD